MTKNERKLWKVIEDLADRLADVNLVVNEHVHDSALGFDVEHGWSYKSEMVYHNARALAGVEELRKELGEADVR